MAAGLRTLELIEEEGFFDRLSTRTAAFMMALTERAQSAGVPFTTNCVGGMFGIFFTDSSSVHSFQDVMACDTARFNQFFHGMLEEGVYLAPSAFEAGFVSAAHDDVVIERTLVAAEKVFKSL
jgi:glutamate-1-semialdehyde 2,1-aminomutase